MRWCSIVLLAACGSAPATPAIVNATPSIAQPDAPVATCEGNNHRLHGTTCCESVGDDDKVPGMTFLSCTGPQIGKACTKQGDCDIVCSCDDPHRRLSPSNGPVGPSDGTRGIIGVCGGSLQVGVWMCELDEHGVVTHAIVD